MMFSMMLSTIYMLFFGATDTDPPPSSLEDLYAYATDFVGIISLLIGVVLVASTIFAGIQYTTAGGDSGKVQKAKGRLASNILVLVLYMFSAAILNWLLPG